MLKNYSKVEVDEYGDKEYLNDEDENHRLDGPAIEYLNGSKRWLINGNYHRNIDLAEEYSDGEKLWRFKGERHRGGGLCNSVYKCYYSQGKLYTKQQYFNKVRKS